ncbi:uncharacterized protein LOC101855351 [Aplysia californica]|uniref:Uncharacterized protein LOC101855351 n=1 Tax=Aplysia californica TaxID=6500 RepID=A0ABM1A3V5_APLCA|nr:uncharacterized protein LOC101855351 [Aplysia californica]
MANNSTTAIEIVTKSDTFVAAAVFVSNEASYYIEVTLDLVLVTILAFVGIGTNIIDIVVFGRQGFRDSVNISLSAIATMDLIKCVTGAAARMNGILGLFSTALAVTWKNICTPTLLYLQIFVGYVSYVMAAYVAVERCLCVSMPFKVKSLITPKLTFCMMVMITVVVMGSFSVVFFIYRIDWVYSDKYGQTIAIYGYSDFYDRHNFGVMWYYNLIGVINPILSFTVMVVCTVIIFYHLRKASKFRQQSQQGGQESGKGGSGDQGMSSRDRQVIKMLLVVIIIYIINFVPRISMYVAKLFVKEYYFLKRYHNIFMLSTYTLFVIDFLNASMNLFIYLTMSSNFRATFFSLFIARKKV